MECMRHPFSQFALATIKPAMGAPGTHLQATVTYSSFCCFFASRVVFDAPCDWKKAKRMYMYPNPRCIPPRGPLRKLTWNSRTIQPCSTLPHRDTFICGSQKISAVDLIANVPDPLFSTLNLCVRLEPLSVCILSLLTDFRLPACLQLPTLIPTQLSLQTCYRVGSTLLRIATYIAGIRSLRNPKLTNSSHCH